MAGERIGASFSIDTTALKAGLAQANRLIRESQSEFKAAAAGMDDWTKSQDGLAAKIKSLNEISDIQRKKIEALEKQYQEAGYASDDMSAAAVSLRTQINNQKAALGATEAETRKYEDALADLENGAESANDEVEGLGRAAENSAEGFTIAKGAIANLISDGLKSLVGACSSAVKSMMNLSAETQEYREDIGKLNTAWQAAGRTSEEATNAYKELYAVLGEEDRSVEAVNHLAKLTRTQQDVAKWTDICAGVWGTFGDSLPIEGLTEAANEVAKTGELTGVLTDAINWATTDQNKWNDALGEGTSQQIAFAKGIKEGMTAEDAFKEALAACSDEQERADLITRTLNGLYKDAADIYKENNKSVIEARKATSDYTDVMADLGAEVEPLNTGISELKTEFIKGLVPSVKNKVIPQMKEFLREVKQSGAVKELSKEVGNLADKGFNALAKAANSAVKAFNFVAKNLDTIIDVVKSATAAFIAYKSAMAISSVVSSLTTALKSAGSAMGALNAVMAANPAGAVAAAIGLLVGGIVLLSGAQEDATESTQLLTDKQLETIEASRQAAESYNETKAAADELSASQMASVDYVTNNLIPQLQALTDENGNVKDSDKARADFILGELNNALGTEYTQISDIIGKNGELERSIYDVIEAKKAQILLSAYEDVYREAITKVAEAEQARVDAASGVASATDDLYKKTKELEQAENDLSEAYSKGDSRYSMSAENRAKTAREAFEKSQTALTDQKRIYEEAETSVKNYYNIIDKYEAASTASVKGETDKVIQHLRDLGNGYDDATTRLGQSKEDQIKILEQQVVDSEVQLRLLEEDYKRSQGNMTSEEKVQAEARIEAARVEAESALTEYKNVGANMVSGMVEGLESGQGALEDAIRRIVRAALDAAEDEAEIESPSKLFRRRVGKNIGLGVALGVGDSTKDVIESVRGQISAVGNAYNMQAVGDKLSSTGHAQAGTIEKTAEQPERTAQNVTVYQTNNYSQAHSRYELYKSKQQTAAAVRLAMGV